MNATAVVYATNEQAIAAVQELKRTGYPIQQISLIGMAVIIDDLMHVKQNRGIKNMPVIIGAIAGPILGMLSGMKLFAIQGLGFLFGIGAMIGALAGFSIGIFTGGGISLSAILIIRSRVVLKYREHLEEEGFQIIVHGNEKDVSKAKAILDSHKESLEATSH